MDFLNNDIRDIYRKYLIPTLGSALVMSIYSFVDTIAVGQYAGAIGTAALAVINPLYTLMYVVGSICALGGSVRYGHAIGKGKREEADNYFSASLVLCIVLTGLIWLVFVIFLGPILRLFGANDAVFPTAMAYGRWIIWCLPIIVLPDYLGAFLRIDGDPKRALRAVMIGGSLNMFLDWLLVFPLRMGVSGAAIATVLGTLVQAAIMSSHFFSPKNRLRFVHTERLNVCIKKILRTGFSSSLLDLGNVALAIVMNQMMRIYGGTEALGIYGVVNTITILFQALFAGVGQTILPAVSVNHGAGRTDRVRAFYRRALFSVLVLGILFMLPGEIFPGRILYVFIHAEGATVSLGSYIFRLYFPCFLFLGYNVLATFILQALLRHQASMWIAILRSFVFPLFALFILPRLFGAAGVYSALTVSEAMVAAGVWWYIRTQTLLLTHEKPL